MSIALVIGGSGLLGRSLVRQLRAEGDEVHWTYSSSKGSDEEGGLHLDIRINDAVETVISSLRPDHVYLSAAMTNVDQCERSPTTAWEVNAVGTMNVAKACSKTGAKLLYISTDYVFNGMKGSRYYEFDDPDPINIYGMTKLEGERCTLDAGRDNLVCRVSVLYGPDRPLKPDFVTWLVGELGKGNRVRVFRDQYVSPTYAPHCASVMSRLMRSGKKGTYHTSGPDCMNRYEMALIVAEVFSLDPSLIEPITMQEAGLIARRPGSSCLNIEKVRAELDMEMMCFRDGVKDMRARRTA
ncbi:MAG: dTDP-4-dehydrorhamnose reductase [Methanomassiliicoccales archaeon]|nr:MAG: dTDP-4-dehydrorhamnose reductase [Methanomassiliicoccales archaeon]